MIGRFAKKYSNLGSITILLRVILPATDSGREVQNLIWVRRVKIA